MAPKRPKPIASGLAVEGIDWQAISQADIATHSLAPGTVVTGFKEVRSYMPLEDRVLSLLGERALLGGPGQASAIGSNRLPVKLREPNFYGNYVNGRAFVFPYDSTRPPLYYRQARSLPDLPGFSLLVVADLSSSTGWQATLAQEVHYYVTHYRDERPDETVTRIMGGRIVSNAQGIPFEAVVTQSVTNAHKVAQHALRFVYSGGLPGSRR